MAQPQLENGYTEIANELIEAFCQINLSPYESRVLWCIIRKTYGWKKKTDRIAGSQIVAMTGITKDHVSKTLKSLRGKNIIMSSDNKHIGIQKDYQQWKTRKLPVQATISDEKLPVQATEVASSGNKKLPVQATEVASSGNKKLPAGEPQKQIKKLLKPNKATIQKKVYGEFQNVLLSDDEYQKLQDRFTDLSDKIETLSAGIESKGYKYKSHYATLLSWDRMEKKRREDQYAKTGRRPRPGSPDYKYEDPD